MDLFRAIAATLGFFTAGLLLVVALIHGSWFLDNLAHGEQQYAAFYFTVVFCEVALAIVLGTAADYIDSH